MYAAEAADGSRQPSMHLGVGGKSGLCEPSGALNPHILGHGKGTLGARTPSWPAKTRHLFAGCMIYAS